MTTTTNAIETATAAVVAAKAARLQTMQAVYNNPAARAADDAAYAALQEANLRLRRLVAVVAVEEAASIDAARAVIDELPDAPWVEFGSISEQMDDAEASICEAVRAAAEAAFLAQWGEEY